MADAETVSILSTVPKGKQLKSLTRQEVAKHNKEGDLWMVIDTLVFDLSKFVDMHPGSGSLPGSEETTSADDVCLAAEVPLSSSTPRSPAKVRPSPVLSPTRADGRADATESFFGLHRSEVLKKYGRYAIGTIEGDFLFRAASPHAPC